MSNNVVIEKINQIPNIFMIGENQITIIFRIEKL